MVFQSFALMPHMSVIDNVAFGLEISGVEESERHKRALEALKQVGLDGHAYSYPHQLSGGMQQRVGLARALANDPAILLMDEAFSALDPLIRHEMQGELIRLQAEQHRTIIFISHDIEEAIRIGHRIAIMEGGRVVQIGTPQELLCSPANDYVRAFFKGFDASKILKAGDVAKICAEHPYAMDQSMPTLRDDVLLQDVFHIVADAVNPVAVLDRQGVFKGTISKSLLLQTMSRH
jgi:glycine betaine/proline transport system ATP-binding protein